MWRTYGQWLQRNSTSSVRPSRSASFTVVPSADGSSKSGAGVPSGTISAETPMRGPSSPVGGGRPHGSRHGPPLAEGEAELEPGSGGDAGVAGEQVAALGPGQLAGNVEPQAEAATGLQPGEALEDPLTFRGWHAAALVLNGQDRVGPVALADQPDQAVLGRVLAGVVDQVAEDLQDRVGRDPDRQAG